MSKTDDLRIANIQAVANAATIMSEIPISDRAARVVASHRADIHRVLQGEDDRLVVVTGPCSIHDPSAAIDYARHLAPLVERHKGELIVLMRVYFEKPRTTVGWKGLINDPNLDGSFDINSGLRIARKLLSDIGARCRSGNGISGSIITSIYRRPRELGRDWSPNDRKSASSGDCLWIVLPRGF